LKSGDLQTSSHIACCHIDSGNTEIS